MLILNPKSPIPLYQQIADYYKNSIISGELVSGDKLPAIEACAKDLSCSKITVTNAYKRLMQQGYVTVRNCKGYIVCRNPQRAVSQIKANISKLMIEARRNKATDEDIREIVSIVEGRTK